MLKTKPTNKYLPPRKKDRPQEASLLAPLLDIKATGFAGWLDRVLGKTLMHPAPSVILFTVLSGMGFGCLAFLGLGLAVPLPAGRRSCRWGLGYGLAVGGLMASTFHLGNPQRFLRAFSQWRPSGLAARHGPRSRPL